MRIFNLTWKKAIITVVLWLGSGFYGYKLIVKNIPCLTPVGRPTGCEQVLLELRISDILLLPNTLIEKLFWGKFDVVAFTNSFWGLIILLVYYYLLVSVIIYLAGVILNKLRKLRS